MAWRLPTHSRSCRATTGCLNSSCSHQTPAPGKYASKPPAVEPVAVARQRLEIGGPHQIKAQKLGRELVPHPALNQEITRPPSDFCFRPQKRRSRAAPVRTGAEESRLGLGQPDFLLQTHASRVNCRGLRAPDLNLSAGRRPTSIGKYPTISVKRVSCPSFQRKRGVTLVVIEPSQLACGER